MATQIVMDHTGDRRHQFDPQNASEVVEAEKRFKQLTGKGFTAAARTTAGETMKVASFDPTAEETIFFPRLVGG
jgi:protein-disulfide isomerase-like protein with CxxC motif